MLRCCLRVHGRDEDGRWWLPTSQMSCLWGDLNRRLSGHELFWPQASTPTYQDTEGKRVMSQTGSPRIWTAPACHHVCANKPGRVNLAEIARSRAELLTRKDTSHICHGDNSSSLLCLSHQFPRNAYFIDFKSCGAHACEELLVDMHSCCVWHKLHVLLL